MQVRFNQGKKLLKIEVADVALLTPFQPHVLAEVLTAIYQVTQPKKDVKFEYYKQNDTWGFRAIANSHVK